VPKSKKNLGRSSKAPNRQAKTQPCCCRRVLLLQPQAVAVAVVEAVVAVAVAVAVAVVVVFAVPFAPGVVDIQSQLCARSQLVVAGPHVAGGIAEPAAAGGIAEPAAAGGITLAAAEEDRAVGGAIAVAGATSVAGATLPSDAGAAEHIEGADDGGVVEQKEVGSTVHQKVVSAASQAYGRYDMVRETSGGQSLSGML